jgi:hypothetical protein
MAPAGATATKADIQRVFKFVSGVLNGAHTADRCCTVEAEVHRILDTDADATFESACEALAQCIERDGVPQQGLSVLKDVLSQSSLATQASSRLRVALGVQQIREISVDDVQKIFKVVAGILNGAMKHDECDHVKSELCRLLEAEVDATFESACDALACGIEHDKVPPQGVAVLQKLLGLGPDSPVSSRLASALGVKFLPKCTADDATNAGSGDEPEILKPEAEAGHVASKVVQVAVKKDRQISAQKIFKYVTSTLRGTSDHCCDLADLAVWHQGTQTLSFSSACEALAVAIKQGGVPDKPLNELCSLSQVFAKYDLVDTPLEQALLPLLCPKCKADACSARQCACCNGSGRKSCDACQGSGRYSLSCHSCNGTGKGRTKMYCPSCNGSGRKTLGDCKACDGLGQTVCVVCDTRPEHGSARPFCRTCASMAVEEVKRVQQERRQAQQDRKKEEAQRHQRQAIIRPTGPPPEGVSIDRCNRADLSRLQNLWLERESQQMPGGHRARHGEVLSAWKVDNPLLAYQFKQHLDSFKRTEGREMDKLEGYHGTMPANVLSICSSGFDSGRRAGQVYGAGEYFAKNPHVSVDYCRGGEYMLVCRLSLGKRSSTPANLDGDHIWVPENGYYVIKQPQQVLVQYIVKFKRDQSSYSYGGAQISESLERHLSSPYSTKPPPQRLAPPRPRPCYMTRPATTCLWIGLMSPHIPEEELKEAVRRFLTKNAPGVAIKRIQIVRTHFSKAEVHLEKEMPRATVHQLNDKPFVVDNTTSRVCVEDYFGSPNRECPKWIAGYCRGQNLKFTQPCYCKHKARPTEGAHYTLTPIPLEGAKGDEIRSKFMASAPFHNGMPEITGIKQIKNTRLAQCHEEYRQWLTDKHGEEPAVQELYHGTNNKIHDLLYTHGLQPPSDMKPSDACPVSGGKGLCTSLCTNTCEYCTEKHQWGRCHMYGLGIYLGDMSQKSNRYVSQPQNGRHKMIVCSVLGKSFEIDGFLRGDRIMHDVINVRSLTAEMMDDMIEVCQPCKAVESGVGANIIGMDGSSWGRVLSEDRDCWRLSSGRIAKKDTEGQRWKWCKEEISMECCPPEKSDLMFVKGLGARTRVGFSVVNSEYIAFHPHQCLPLYEIEYTLR